MRICFGKAQFDLEKSFTTEDTENTEKNHGL